MNIKQCDFCPCICKDEDPQTQGWKILPEHFLPDQDKKKDVCPTCVKKMDAGLTNSPPPPSTDHSKPPISIEQMEKEHILATLEWTKWNKSQAAQLLGIERSTLDRKLKKYETTRPE